MQSSASTRVPIGQAMHASPGARPENELWHRQLIHSLPAAVYTCDRAGRVTMYNDAAVALWGHAPPLGEPLPGTMHRVYRADGTPLAPDELPMAIALRERVDLHGREIVIERPDGTRRNVLSHPKPLYDTRGDVVGGINMLVDITERKQAEEARLRSEQMLRLATDAAGIGTWTNDLVTHVVRWSPELERTFGLEPGTFQGTARASLDLVHPDDRATVVSRIEEAIAHSRDFAFEFRFRHASGECRWMVTRGRAVSDGSGRPALVVGTCEDITERKRAADELAATRDQLATQVAMLTRLSELSRRLAVAHDLASALQAILQTLVDLHGGQHGILALCDEATGQLTVGAAVDFDEDAFAPLRRIAPGSNAGATATAFATRERVIVEDVETDARFPGALRESARSTGFRAVHSTPVQTRDGEMLGVLSVYFREPRVPTRHEMDLADVCALHAADTIENARDEQAVRESEQRFRTMADHAPVMIWVREPDGACSFLSRSWYEFTGQDAQHALGNGWLDAVNPIDRTFVQAIYLSASERRVPFRIEYRLRANDGEYHWVIDAAAPRFADDGAFRGYVGSLIDITERKRTEVALQESEARFRRMADGAPVLIWVSDADKQATWFNQPWLDFVGRSMAQEIGSGWTESVHPDDVEQCVRTYALAFDAREPFAMEFRLRRRDGEYRRIADRGVPLYDGAGAFAGYIGSCFDVTDERRKEEALKDADRRKDEFLASLAHELRNPLAPMRNALEIMSLRRDDADEVERARAMLERQMRQMVRLIDDLLDVNRISRGKIQLRKERIDLASAVASAVETSRPLIDEHGHELSVDVPAEPIEVDADMTRLAQVFANLLNNAAKYTDRNGRLGVRVRREGGAAVVDVRDDGAGIAPQRLSHVFEMFTQFESGVADAHGGLGIGLAIAKRLVELHGGTIEAASEGPGEGSVFTVRLPALPPAAARPAESAASGTANAAVSQRRVLLAEDHKDSAASLARLLEILGHSVRVAHDGIEALALAEDFLPHLILLDIGMPRMNGYEACAKLRESLPGRDAVIVALTGWGQEADRQRSREAGFDHHLVKPVELDALEAVLAEAAPRVA